MKYFINTKKIMPVLGLVGASLLGIQNAQAYSSFGSTATVSYTIDSIVNTSGTANDLTDLFVTGGFAVDTFSSYIDIPLGSDGVTTPFASIGDDFVDPVVGSYTKIMNVSGSVNDGVVDAFYLGLFNLDFVNDSSNSFDIQITLNYDLSAAANGQYAENVIQLDYLNDAETFTSGVDGFSVLANTPGSLSDALVGSAVYNFTLAAGQFDALYVDVGISGYLEASPVPVPAAFWLFGSALVVPALRKFKQEIS